MTTSCTQGADTETVSTPQPLHPNLARIAAKYDQIIERYGRGEITAAQARAEVSTLVARDDEGASWLINPDTGGWLRRNRSGELVTAVPPTYGLGTPTPHDVSPGSAFNPDSRIDFHEVSDELLYSPNHFAGSTRVSRVPLPENRLGLFARLRQLFSR
jgi:hypothetical protein